MSDFMFADLMPIFPEIAMAVMGMLLLVLGVFKGNDGYRFVSRYAVVALLAVAAVLVKYAAMGENMSLWQFQIDGFALLMKIVVVLCAMVAIVMSKGYLEREGLEKPEIPVLIMFSTLGMMMMVSADDLIALYLGLELQSLPLYILAAIQRDDARSSEAGVKYFVLGALSSGLLLYGASLIYGFTGATDFATIASTFWDNQPISFGVITGMVLMLAGLAFKISAVPFHMWAPDVYEGAPTPVTAFFAIAPKIAAVALLTRVLVGPFADLAEQWQQIIIFMSMASMALGGIAAIGQNNIKRMLAYSSIGHMGYVLIGLAAIGSNSGTPLAAVGLEAVILYMIIYVIMSAGTFAIVLSMKRHDRMVENISDLAGLSRSQPRLAAVMAIFMFSMSGIPPLAGFFGKFFIFMAAVDAQLYALAIVGVLTSVIAAYYYLRVIKVMYFDDPAEEPLDMQTDTALGAVMFVSVIFVLLFVVHPDLLMQYTKWPAMSML